MDNSTSPSRNTPTRARDRGLIATTTRLVEFLRKLAVTRNQRILDYVEYETRGGRLLWLADLPGEATPDLTAEPGDVLLSVNRVSSEPAPEMPDVLRGWLEPELPLTSDVEPVLRESGPVQEIVTVDGASRTTTEIRDLDDVPEVAAAYHRWLPRWRTWAENDRVLARQRQWHRDLTWLAERLSQQDDEYELVLATGLLTWQVEETRIRNHVLVTSVQVELDPETGTVSVAVHPDATTRLQDRELLEECPDVRLSRVGPLRDQLRDQPAQPLGDEAKNLLEEWSGQVFDMPVRYAYEWEQQVRADPVPSLRFAPALVLRRRGRASLIRYYDDMLATLSGPDAVAPLGLAQLVTTLEPRERMEWLEQQGAATGELLGADPLFPLPANAKQTEIMTRLRGNNGVVVQGPPGTGKTHTIANLISALLAQGQRVLVTSQKAQALRVLREKLPREVANLCISMTDLGRGGSTELESSVKEMSSRYTDYEPEVQQKQISARRRRLLQQRGRVAELEEKIRALRESETYQHDAVAPGYRGTLSAIAEKLRRLESRCGWMPTPLPAKAGDTAPLSESEAGELIELLRTRTPARVARTGQRLVDPTTLPTMDQVQRMVEVEATAHRLARESETPLSITLRDCPSQLADTLREQVEAATTALRLTGLVEDPAGWDSDDWAVTAIRDGVAGRELSLWQKVYQYGQLAHQAEEALGDAGLRTVQLPEAAREPSGVATLLRCALPFREYLNDGGRIRKMFKSQVQADAEVLLTDAHVDGVPPTTVELLDVVIAHLTAWKNAFQARRGWQLVDVDLDGDVPIERLVSQLVDHANRIENVNQFLAAVDDTRQALLDAGLRVPLGSAGEWKTFADTLDALHRRIRAEEATTALDALADDLHREISKGAPPPELEQALSAVRARDPQAYRAALDGLAAAHPELAAQRRCDDLLGRLRSAHPGLATFISDSHADRAWASRLGAWAEAWAWGRARTFFDRQRQPGLEQRLEAELADATERRLRATAELAASQAWQHCLSRMTADQAQALRSYQLHMGKVGKGSGRHAARYRRMAREAMRSAKDAVPAWVMPLEHVLETIPPERDSFDVVIVDEASQAGLESLFLLWLAPRVIVVGDDKQCAPSAVTHGALAPIFDSLDTDLPELPGYVRGAFTPNSSLFDILLARFGGVIRLREHFRCMPEIIGYSSHQFYPDEPLVPLRQFGSDRLPPIRHHRVTGGFTEGTGTKLRNPREAEAIVEQIQTCLDDSAYRDKTFGVIVLQGSGQIDLIRSLLAARIDPRIREKRKLRVGSAPDFQGDERDVVFLSMVVTEPRNAITDVRFQRIFNVAASRARDQMWLFHSVSLDLLSSTDLRRSLLSYALNPPPALTVDELSDVTADNPHPRFDSRFEQRVFLRIRERGYQVIPQYEVNGRRIDLVVVGANGQLAVECDGDAWHTEPDQVAADLDRERELKRAGWRFWRVRGSEFIFDPDAALASLWETLDQLDIHPVGRDGDWKPVALDPADDLTTAQPDPVPAGALGSETHPAEQTPVPTSPPHRPASPQPTPPPDRATSRSATVDVPAVHGGARAAVPARPRPSPRHRAPEPPHQPPRRLPNPKPNAAPEPPRTTSPGVVRGRGTPPIRPGGSITSYTRGELRQFIRWLAVVGTPKTHSALLAEALRVLAPVEKDSTMVTTRLGNAIVSFLEEEARRAVSERTRSAPQPADDDHAALRQQFEKEMVDIFRRALAEAGYRASTFLSMVKDLGGFETARRLLDSPTLSDGFVALWERGRLDLTVEAVVISPLYAPLFTHEQRARARSRLETRGFDTSHLM